MPSLQILEPSAAGFAGVSARQEAGLKRLPLQQGHRSAIALQSFVPAPGLATTKPPHSTLKVWKKEMRDAAIAKVTIQVFVTELFECLSVDAAHRYQVTTASVPFLAPIAAQIAAAAVRPLHTHCKIHTGE